MLIIYLVLIVLKTKSVGEEENNAYKYLCYLGNLFIFSASTKLNKRSKLIGQTVVPIRKIFWKLHVGFAIKLNI